ncbi:MAG: hypothetical protein KIS92_04160 [Planctomycetota bacterium]|nr:hypothetical protein [Planctomycetota bacterium]
MKKTESQLSRTACKRLEERKTGAWVQRAGRKLQPSEQMLENVFAAECRDPEEKAERAAKPA